MAFPVNIDNSSPPQSETPQLGAGHLRTIRQNLLDLFTLPNATNIAWAVFDGTLGIFPVVLTNKTGGALVAGDAVVIDTGNDSAVALGDTVSTLAKVVIAQTAIANNASGPFVGVGRSLVNTTGAVTRGDYLRKSATTKVLETTGVAMSATQGPPVAAVGVALTAAAAGQATAFIFATPPVLESGTWTDVSGSRSLNTAYQNTSGKKRRVSGSVYGINVGKLQISWAVGAANPPTVIIGGVQVDVNAAATQHNGSWYFEVPNNHYYKINASSTGAVNAWSELDE